MNQSSTEFRRLVARFERLILRQSGERFVSFHQGLPASWEGYKERVRFVARDRLGFRGWKTADIGTGKILNQLLQAIEISPTPDIPRNNLVAWQPRYGAKGQSHRALLDARTDRSLRLKIEQWLYAFYRGDLEDAQAFERLVALVGNRYDLVAYLFFLKDWQRFMPIAPTTFDKAFVRLGIQLKTSRQCSWDNYRQYNEALQEVRGALVDEEMDARLIDAHSFCWMLVRLDSVRTELASAIAPPLELNDMLPHVIEMSGRSSGIEVRTIEEGEFAERDEMRRRVGKLAESCALESEQQRLEAAGRLDLAQRVKLVSDQPLLGYDILSFELDGTFRHIEVKATRKYGKRFQFILTQNEWTQCKALPNYHFYLVIGASLRTPKVWSVKAASVTKAALSPIAYRVGLARGDGS